MSKYEPLREYLATLRGAEWRPTFNEIETVLGFELPKSARAHPAWWANEWQSHSHAAAWLDAGWETEDLTLTGERVTFRRRGAIRKAAPLSDNAATRITAAPSFESAPHEWDESKQLHAEIGMTWKPIGRVVLDGAGRLGFPKAPAAPALYRFRIRQNGRESLYFGESDNLTRRFGNYRNPGPTQQTSLRINETFRAALQAGAEIGVAAVIGGAWIKRNGVQADADLSSKATRRFFECAAIVEAGGTDVDSLNR
jgi:hypothetical protein